jgi:PRC-barrel domain
MEAQMLKRLMISTVAVAMVTGSALAQETTTAPAPAVTPAPTTMPAKPQVVTQQTADHVTQQTADQWLASKFKGTDVIGTDNGKIGDVNDVLFDHDGKVLAYIVGVGGFLGIGSKDVALAPAAFQVQPASDKENMKLKLAMTKDELKNAVEFKPYKPPAPTVGVGQPTIPAERQTNPPMAPRQ